MDDIYIDRVIKGDPESFRYFIKKYKDMGFNVAVAIIKDDHYAEEVLQDAFMRAFKALNSFRRASSFKTWFYRIVVNEAFKRLKHMQKTSLQSPHEDEIINQDIPSINDQPDQQERVKDALDKLTAKERLAVNLFYLEGYTIEEISGITTWSKSNAKVILHRARKRLRNTLNEND